MTEELKQHLRKRGFVFKLDDVRVNEVSLVDRPANRGSTVAFFKRDSGDPQPDNDIRKEKKMSKLETVISKSGGATRDEIMGAIRRKSEKIAKSENITVEQAEARVWKTHPEAYTAYCSAPALVAKRDPAPAPRMSPAEAALDAKARKKMRQTGESFAKSYADVMKENPDLYQQADAERSGAKHAGVKYHDGAQFRDHQGNFTKQSQDDEPDDEMDDECPNADCSNEDLPEGAKFCPDCGTDLTKAKAAVKAKRQAAAKR